MGLWARITGSSKVDIKETARKAALSAVQPRSTSGTFSSIAKEAAVPAATNAIVLKNQADALGSTNEALKSVIDMVKTFNTAVSEEAAARYGPSQQDMLEDDIESVDTGTDWLAVANQVIPQVMPTIEKLAIALSQRTAGSGSSVNAPGAAWTGFPVANSTQQASPQVAPSSPSAPSPTSNAPPITPEMLIQLAKANKVELAGIKAIAGSRIGAGLAQNGLTVDVLRKAIDNLAKIVPKEQAQDVQDEEQTTLMEAVA